MARIAPSVFADWQSRAAQLAPEDDSYKARVARATTILHRDWLAAHEERTKLRWAWHAFFQNWDVLLTPAAAGAAWPHDQKGERLDRVITVNGKPENTNDQLFWAGISRRGPPALDRDPDRPDGNGIATGRPDHRRQSPGPDLDRLRPAPGARDRRLRTTPGVLSFIFLPVIPRRQREAKKARALAQRADRGDLGEPKTHLVQIFAML